MGLNLINLELVPGLKQNVKVVPPDQKVTQNISTGDLRPYKDPYFMRLSDVDLKLKSANGQDCHLVEDYSSTAAAEVNLNNVSMSNCHSPTTITTKTGQRYCLL